MLSALRWLRSGSFAMVAALGCAAGCTQDTGRKPAAKSRAPEAIVIHEMDATALRRFEVRMEESRVARQMGMMPEGWFCDGLEGVPASMELVEHEVLGKAVRIRALTGGDAIGGAQFGKGALAELVPGRVYRATVEYATPDLPHGGKPIVCWHAGLDADLEPLTPGALVRESENGRIAFKEIPRSEGWTNATFAMRLNAESPLQWTMLYVSPWIEEGGKPAGEHSILVRRLEVAEECR